MWFFGKNKKEPKFDKEGSIKDAKSNIKKNCLFIQSIYGDIVNKFK